MFCWGKKNVLTAYRSSLSKYQISFRLSLVSCFKLREKATPKKET